MADSFQGSISDVFQVIIDTLKVDTDFNEGVADDFDKMTYPAAQLIPDSSIYQSELEYSDTFTVRFVFEKGRNDVHLIEATEEVEAAVDTLLVALESETVAKEFKPTEFNYLVAENNGTRLNVIEVVFTVSKLVDFT